MSRYRRRIALGLAGVVLSGLPVRDRSIGPREEAMFRAVNGLPDRIYHPVWLVMQAGTVGAAPVAGAIAVACGRRDLGRRLVVSGVLSWALSKVIKRVYRRPRPGSLVRGARLRGSEPSGLGYVSGHAGVAVALGVAAYPYLSPAGRAAVVVAVPTVGLCRIYVGAHLPLDVVGGAAMGLAVDGIVGRLLPARLP